MGIIFIDGIVSNKGIEREARFLVDGGATYSLLKKEVWEYLGLEPMRKMEFILADGTKLNREVSECFMRFPFGSGHSPVILGEEGDDENLLGAVTLEILGLVLDPFKRELRPARMLLI